MARSLSNLLKVIDNDVRNILDESDAILQPKYQLIYTVGQQQNPDGGQLRWIVQQAAFKRVSHHMKLLWHEYGDKMIEFNEKFGDRDDIFTPCRILDRTIVEHLKWALIDDFLDRKFDIDFPEMVQETKDRLRLVLGHTERDPTELIKHFSLQEKNIVLILRGLFGFELLGLILARRWRVNYGVKDLDEHRQKRKKEENDDDEEDEDEDGEEKRKEKKAKQMAIPFRAKDVPADMSEFGHTDAAIGFTLLSYYYSGKQLRSIYSNF